MKAIIPVPITEAMLLDSSINEGTLTYSSVNEDLAEFITTSTGTITTTAPVWNSTTAYALNAYCMMTTGIHKIYQCLVGNTNFPPNTNLDGLTPKWQEVSSTNRWKMFDAFGSTQSQATEAIGVLIALPRAINSIALVGIGGVSYIQIVSRGINGNALDVRRPNTANKSDFVFTDIVSVAGGSVIVSIEGYAGSGGIVKCGKLEIGNWVELGDINYGSSVGMIDYSTKNTDPWGNTTIIKRPFTKRISAKLTVLSSRLDYIDWLLTTYRSTPLVWIGTENIYTLLIVYGFYRDFDINISHPMDSDCSLTIEGFI